MIEKEIIVPNLEWYLEKSASQSISPRCPFATVQECSRFYQSLSLLGNAGGTKIPEKEDKKILKKWKRSPLWPVTDEQKTSIAGPKDDHKHFWNFCPEVSFERFGLFAHSLNRYADDIDTKLAHSNLAKVKAPPDDWRWTWASVQPLHYSECSLYSIVIKLKARVQNKDEKQDIIDLKPNFYGIGLNINALMRKIKDCMKIK